MNTKTPFLNQIVLLLIHVILLVVLPGKNLLSQVSLTEKQWILPTYTVAEPDKNPVFFSNEAYQGASRHYYPLALNDQYTHERVYKEWKTIILENEYIELAVTPEIGGKLYYATDKTNDYHFIYKNNVVRPANIGMTGAWVSGGIEWCVMHHHRASTFLPIDYTTSENEDGSKTIRIGETEPRHGMRWTIGITVYPGKSYFEVEGSIFNCSPYTHTFLYWANAAVHANKDYQTIFPPGTQIATYHSKTSFTRWPVSTEVYTGVDFTEGVDISWWKNVLRSNSFFAHELKEDFMGGYDHGKNTGTVHIGDHHIVKGAKLWEWGAGPRGQATEARFTEDDGPYVELMTGAYSDNQPDYSWIRPYEVKRWKQYWYPVRGIQGFKNANLNGAVNLEVQEENKIFLGYYSTKKVDNAIVILMHKDKVIFEKNIEISPDKPFTKTVKLDDKFDLTDLYTELINPKTKEVLIEYQPIKQEPVKELPSPVKAYPAPEEISTIEELFLTGSRIEQFYTPGENPMDWYMEALRRDPYDVRTNIAVGNNYLKNGNYIQARSYFDKAIKRLTKDYTRPSTCEAFYLQGLTLKALRLYDEAVDMLYRATWDYAYHSSAYFQLAQISVMRGDFNKALLQINESLGTNARNNRAIALKASILRRMGDNDGAMAALETIIKDDPLDFRIRNEYFLAVRESGDFQKAEKLIKSLSMEMRNYDQNYLELAVGYINDGLLDEAQDALLRFKGSNPLFDYYLGYIYDKSGNRDSALNHFRAATEQSADYVFPYRLETVEVLKTALEYIPGDGKAYYFIGNILYEKQPEIAIENWENAVKYNPALAIACRNLGWGYYRHYNDVPKAISYYEKAISLDKNEAIYYSELDVLYEMSNSPIEKRLTLFAGNNEMVKKRDYSFIRQISVLTLAGEAEKALEYLEGTQFAYREGSSWAREVIIDAQLMSGLKYYMEKNYEKALAYFLEAQIPDEEAGSAWFGNRNLQVNYYIGLAYEALGNKAKANTYFKMSAEQDPGKFAGIMVFYQGLSYAKTGNHIRAKEIFKSMISDANSQLQGSDTSVYGVIFGERESENTLKSRSYALRGLGYKGLGRIKQSDKDLEKAVELSLSNLWATVELAGY